MKNVLIIGDFILDTYVFGSVEKISPEAPVMEFALNGKVEYKFGGAANVAYILDNLGVNGYFATKIGLELASEGALKKKGLQFKNIELIPIVHGKTCQKIRLLDENYHQHILRVAVEDGDLPKVDFIQKMKQHDARPDLILFSDYQKGLLSESKIHYIREKFLDTPILVAIKYNWKGYMRRNGLPNCNLVIGNHKEIAATFGNSPKAVLDNPVQYAERIIEEKGFQNCIITLGAKGAAYFSGTEVKGNYVPTKEQEIFDVTGAGDSFFATVAYLWEKLDIETIVKKANVVAGMNVLSLGNTLVNSEIL